MQSQQSRLNPETDLASLRHHSLDGAAATAGSQAVKFVLQFLSQIWLARLISPAEYGLVAMVVPILGFISSISDMGIGRALVQPKWISQAQISALFWLSTAISAAISLGLIVLSPLIGLLYHEPKTVPITIALATLFLIGGLGVHPAAILNRHMRIVRMAAIEVIASALGLAVGILTAMNGCGYWSLIYMQAATTVASLLMTWWSARWWPSRPRWDPSATRSLKFGASLTVSNVAIYFSMTADNMIVGAVGGKVALGLYDKAYRLVVSPLMQLSAPVGRVAIPLLSRLHDEPERYVSAFRRMIQLPNLLCIPGLIFGMFFSRYLIRVFLGPTWSGIAPVFSWVCVGGLGSILYGSASWLFTSQGRGREQMTWSAITSAVSVVSFLIGIRYGAAGVAALGGLGFVLIQTPLIIWAATRVGPVRARHVIKAFVPISFGFMLTAPLVFLFSRFLQTNPLLALCEAFVFTFAVYFSSISLLSSGRELLSNAASTFASYIGRLRTLQQRIPA